ncbi:O-antigen ligase family protein [Alkalitalea saponilacus]|uniref:O-antigen ligase n=1 Tax=Alkalitalea saponilacus TaxID=889453 RepID=A0A1T5GF12_9BACT|nr:O-antigen ligase family protein [Alkalitalea saponilacus]ASB47951.1 hypothetical protein CDL62_01680 [Alkalitalea saponilacus]SKC07014.1 O-antigen ligase [Alkalitalea saponilacus]
MINPSINHNSKIKYTTFSIIYFQIIIVAALFATVFLAKGGLFNALVTVKQYGLEQVALISALFLVISFPFIRTIRLTIADTFVLLFAIWYIFNEIIISGTPFRSAGHIYFDVILWMVVYLFVRGVSHQLVFVWGIAIVWMIVTIMQTGLGLLQLYGFEDSYHGLFSITGTFHNPGPFSGFVVSGLPVALGVLCYTNCYTEVKRSEIPLKRKNRGDTERHGGYYLKWAGITLPYDLIAKYAIQTLAWITLVSVLLVLPPAQSRAAWIAGIVGCLYVVIAYPGILPIRDNLFNRIKKISFPVRALFFAAFLLMTTASVAGLYIMKQGSADGRLLMWQVTSQLIKERPITGHGTGAFNAHYMNEQANWFASGRGTEAQAMVAGSPEAPFNEPLKLWLEKGLIGILIAGGILYLIFFKKRTNNQKLSTNNIKLQTSNFETHNHKLTTINYQPSTQNYQLSTINPELSTAIKGALFTVLTFSLFSYPFDISSFTLQLVVLVAILAGTTKTVFSITGGKVLFLTIPVAMLLIAATIHLVPQRQTHYQAMKTWQEADRFYNMRSYNIAAEAYEEAFPVLQTTGLFLQMYGKALSMDEQYQKSNEILALAQQRFSSQIIQNALGDNHKALGNYPEAEAAYIKSANMNPSLLLPKYLLAKLYTESGQHHKAQQTAEEILNSPVKVESSATREIINEMKSVINEQLSVISEQ